MPKSLEVDIRETGSWKAKDAEGRTLTKTLGQGNEPSGSTRIRSGVANGQCNVLYRDLFEIAEGQSLVINLQDAALQDAAGDPLSLTNVRLIRVVITDNGPVKIGPQNETNGWQGPWSAKDADGYTEVHEVYRISKLQTGWPVSSTNKIVKILNTGTGVVKGCVEFFGIDD